MGRGRSGTETGHRLQEQVEALVAPMLEPLGYEVVLVEMLPTAVRPTVRISVDRLDRVPVSLEDCMRANRLLDASAELDALMPGAYNLEVSSPGVNRPLVRERDFVRFVGEKAQVTTRVPIDGRRNFTGRIADVADGTVRLDLGRTGVVAIQIAEISRANLKPDTRDLFKRLGDKAPSLEVELEVADEQDVEGAPVDGGPQQ